MKIEFEMTEEDLKEILAASKPVRMLALQCGSPSSPQENANRAWAALGEKLGFESATVEAVRGKGDRFFLAEPQTKS